jgi:phosphorylated CTD-interacting factor 1
MARFYKVSHNFSKFLKKFRREKPLFVKDTGFEICKKAIESTRVWLHNNSQATMEVMTVKLAELREECVSFIQTVFSPEVDKVCDELAKNAAKSVENMQLFVQNRGEDIPYQCLNYLDLQQTFPVTATMKTNDTVAVTYKLDEISIRLTHFQKLKTLYSIHCSTEDPNLDKFHSCLYILLRRYHTFFGPGQYEGNGFHAGRKNKK